MRGENDKTPEIIALEAALSALAPTPSRIDRDELMFRRQDGVDETSLDGRITHRWLADGQSVHREQVFAAAQLRRWLTQEHDLITRCLKR